MSSGHDHLGDEWAELSGFDGDGVDVDDADAILEVAALVEARLQVLRSHIDRLLAERRAAKAKTGARRQVTSRCAARGRAS